MTEHTHLLRRGLRAALAVTAVASIAFVGVACTQTGSSGQSGAETPSNTSDAKTSSDATSETDSAADASAADASTGSDSSGTQTAKGGTTAPGGKKILDEELSGQEAIDALGDDIDYVAKLAGKSSDEVKELLLRDKSAHVTTQGRIVYRD